MKTEQQLIKKPNINIGNLSKESIEKTCVNISERIDNFTKAIIYKEYWLNYQIIFPNKKEAKK